jgi:hypothetical protein
MAGGNSLHSTLTASAASSAALAVVATTIATGSPT